MEIVGVNLNFDKKYYQTNHKENDDSNHSNFTFIGDLESLSSFYIISLK